MHLCRDFPMPDLSRLFAAIRLHRGRLVAVLLVLLGIAGFMGLRATRPVPERIPVTERVWAVQTQVIKPADIPAQIVLYGRVEALGQIRVTSPVSGRLAHVHVKDGDRVLAGALLAEIDRRDLLPRLEQAKAEHAREQIRHKHDLNALEEEKVLLALANAQHERMSRLHQARLGAHSALDQSREQLARARLAVNAREQAIAEHPARLAAAKARLEEALRDQERSQMHAPFEALVGKVQAAQGDQLAPQTPILTLFPVEGRDIRARLPLTHTPEVRKAIHEGLKLGVQAQYAGQTVLGTLTGFAGQSDGKGEEVLVRLPREAEFPVGGLVALRLERPLPEGALALPFSALHGQNRVYRVREQRLEAVDVAILGEGQTQAGETFILVAEGPLQAGDIIMSTHLPHALEGLAVQAIQP
jgi:multidrug efflux pump subunit AcrA (membrane-fusion protein)